MFENYEGTPENRIRRWHSIGNNQRNFFVIEEKDEEWQFQGMQSGHFFNDEIWCIDYRDDILSCLFESEKNLRQIELRSPQIDERCALISLIKTTAESEMLRRTTVHLAIYLLDYFMDHHNIAVKRLDMVGLTTLLIAAKLEEKDRCIPKIIELHQYSRYKYHLKDYKIIEKKIVELFDWNLMVPTAATFIEIFVHKLISIEDFQIAFRLQRKTRTEKYKSYQQMFVEASCLAFEFCDLILLDLESHTLSPSQKAAKCLAATRKSLNLPPWSEDLEELTKCSLESLGNISDLINSKINSAGVNSPDSGYISPKSDCDSPGGTESLSEDSSTTPPVKRTRLAL